MILGLIPLILIAIIIVCITWFLRKSVTVKTKFFTGNSTKWILISYAIVLVGAFFFYQTIALDYRVEEQSLSQEESNELHTTFNNAARKGMLDSVKESFVAEEWHFAYEQPTITMKTRHNNHINISVFAERKATNDGKIEGYYYTAASNVDGIDITEEISRVDMELEGNSIVVKRSAPVNLRFAKFTREFTIAQFTEEQTSSHGYFTQMAPEILYLKIPKDLEINNYSDLYIQEVER
jgi:tRNA threonylcarbamoyladenosine modification (KEOPS) complex  Pcc1 subunit